MTSTPPFYVKAKFSYKGTYPEDLVFTKGAVLVVSEVVAAGEWWKARRLAEDGTEMEGEEAEGNVPMGYFTILKDVSRRSVYIYAAGGDGGRDFGYKGR